MTDRLDKRQAGQDNAQQVGQDKPQRRRPRRLQRQDAAPPLDQVVRLCRALGHPLRMRLVVLLSAAPRGGAYVSELAAQLKRAQSTVSHHLGLLVKAGVVVREQRGTWTWYRVVPERLADLREQLAGFITTAAAPAALEVGALT